MFLSFLLLSIFVWLITKLSKSYTATMIYETSLAQLPENRFMYDETPGELEMTIRANGFRLFGMQLFRKNLTVDASKLATVRQRDFILAREQLGQFSEQFPSDIEILSIDTGHAFP